MTFTRWTCVCGATGAAETEDDAWRDWVTHHNASHSGGLDAATFRRHMESARERAA